MEQEKIVIKKISFGGFNIFVLFVCFSGKGAFIRGRTPSSAQTLFLTSCLEVVPRGAYVVLRIEPIPPVCRT